MARTKREWTEAKTISIFVFIVLASSFLYLTFILASKTFNKVYREKMEETKLYRHIIKDSINWPRTKLTSFNSEFTCNPRNKLGPGGSCFVERTMNIKLTYTYTVKGNLYSSSEELSNIKTTNDDDQKMNLGEILNNLHINTNRVYFDPNNPSLSVLTPGVPNRVLANCTRNECFWETLASSYVPAIVVFGIAYGFSISMVVAMTAYYKLSGKIISTVYYGRSTKQRPRNDGRFGTGLGRRDWMD